MKNRFARLDLMLIALVVSMIPLQELSAQYYYRDLELSKQNQLQQQLYRKNKVGQLTLKSFESNGAPTERFVCEQGFNKNYSVSRTFTNGELTGPSSLTAYYNGKGQLYRSVDSSRESMSTYEYQYDSLGRLSLVSSSSLAYGDKSKVIETHQWIYGMNSCPEKMLRIKNGTDTTEVRLSCDEKGNVTEEESLSKNGSAEKIYYYYDSLNRLTDVVRYNPRIKKLIPDYLFEYNENNQLTQMISVQQGSSDYLTWKYGYGENGLKAGELCYDKQKQLLGKITYEYEYRK